MSKLKKISIQVGSKNFVSQIFFLWVFSFILVLRRAKDIKDLALILCKNDTSFLNAKLLDNNWKQELKIASKQNRLPLIRRAIFKTYGALFILNGVWKIVWGVGLWVGAYWLLKKTVIYVRVKSTDIATGHMYALGFLLSSIMASIAIHQLLSQSGRLGLRLKSGLMVMIFKKTILLARIKGGSGDIINLVSNDCQKLADACTNLQYLWSAVLEIIAIMVLSFVELNYSALPALGIILILIPIQIYLGRFKSRIGFENAINTSHRVHIISEILAAIKLIKFYAWEMPFYDRITEIRKRELDLLSKNFIANSLNFMFVFCVPVLVSLFALLTFWLTGNTITPVIGFTVVSVFNTLRYPLLMVPLAINSFSDAATAMKRLDIFFALDEIQPINRYPHQKDSDITISVKNASFKWELNGESNDFSLKNINFNARKGKITAIVGDIGSGKSSLIAALLGQMKLIKGEFKVFGSISYVPQEAWLLNMSLRDNITFGSEFNADIYERVINICALQRDLKLMLNGDQTEIGERGINLSGGQRQRVSLARCVYKLADVVLLDDTLSNVDQEVGRYIFNQCIKGFLRDKTILFVTHQLQYLNQVDDIILFKNGEIIEHGTYTELISLKGHFSTLVGDNMHSNTQFSDTNIDLQNKTTEINNKDFANGNILNESILSLDKNISLVNEKLTVDNQIILTDNSFTKEDSNRISSESIITGSKAGNPESIKLVLEDQSVEYKEVPFWSYLKAGKGVPITTFIFILFFMVHLIRILSDYWISLWFNSSTGRYKHISDTVFIGVYAGSVLLFTIGILSRGILFSYNSIQKSSMLHNKMLKSVLFARMSFFDSTPIGRVLNAFAQHQYAIDVQLADSLMQLLQYTPLCLGAIILIMCVMYQTIGVFFGAAIIAIVILTYLGNVENKLRNHDTISKSSIFSHLTVTIEGLFSIHAYQSEERFINAYCEKIDCNHKYLYGMMEVKCWLAFYLDILTSFIIYSTVIVVIELKEDYPVSTSGLVISNVLQLLVFLQWAVRMFGDVREKMTSVKQVSYYGNSIEQEPITDSTNLPKDWPQNGKITFSNVVLKYQKLGINILKGVNFNIKPREKIGIIGRTGSGKSTLLVTLLRIVEMSEGKIMIDDIDISKINLQDLRKKIAIIPQEPILFVGTIRENVDLFAKKTDEEIWRALDAVHLGEIIRKLELRLNSHVIENGKNFSVGQRQLFCIARAIISECKILVLDEATAAVDLQTDKLIQRAIAKNFENLTVLTIAHRLNTVMESDKILVMDAGRVVEFAPPLVLLQKENGYFTSLLKKTGKNSYNILKKIAEDKLVNSGKNLRDLNLIRDSDNIITDIEDDSQKNKNASCYADSNYTESLKENFHGVKVFSINENFN